MEPWLAIVVTSVGSVTASSGFWAWIMKRNEQKSSTTRLIRGLARREIIAEGLRYIDRGWVSKDEYEEFDTYLFGPYFELGGNGLAEKIVAEVRKLSIRNAPPTTGEISQISF